jgi:predicted ester cyclase
MLRLARRVRADVFGWSLICSRRQPFEGRHTVVHVVDSDQLTNPAGLLQLEIFARRYYDLFNQRAFDEAERFVDPQAVFTYPLAREHFIGRAGYRELVRRWVAGFPDGTVSITNVELKDGPVIQTNWIGHGTHLGVLELPGLPPIPPTHIRAQLPMRETINVVNGLIVESRLEFDPIELRRRLLHF